MAILQPLAPPFSLSQHRPSHNFLRLASTSSELPNFLPLAAEHFHSNFTGLASRICDHKFTSPTSARQRPLHELVNCRSSLTYGRNTEDWTRRRSDNTYSSSSKAFPQLTTVSCVKQAPTCYFSCPVPRCITINYNSGLFDRQSKQLSRPEWSIKTATINLPTPNRGIEND
ncbi:hypothetical protein GE21DRAFT_1084293 [Neurospora crassa]|nr:hypothetical protein GE21DRAFT_1084293 [Neurospora crassa]